MIMRQARPLIPAEVRLHRSDIIARYVSVADALPDGVAIVSGTVQWAVRRPGGGGTDVTALFGAPSVEVDPPEVPGPDSSTRGGPGTVRYLVTPAPTLPAGRYEMTLSLELSSGERISWHGVDVVSDWGAAEA